MPEVVTWTSLGSCGCCQSGSGQCNYVFCDCCDTPGGTVTDTWHLTFDDIFEWTSVAGPVNQTTTLTGDVLSNFGCSWVESLWPSTSASPSLMSLQCCAGIWYVWFNNFDVTFGACPYMVFQLDGELDCCSTEPQTFGLTLLNTAEVTGICGDFFACSYDVLGGGVPPAFTTWPTSVTIKSDCPADCGVDTPCCVEIAPSSFFATIDSPGCAAIDGIVVELLYIGGFVWEGTAPTLCTTCHTMTISLACNPESLLWDFEITFSGTSLNPSPPPDLLTCQFFGIGAPCEQTLDFDCGTMTGEGIFCLAAIGNQFDGSACCNTGGVETTVLFTS